MKLFMAMRIAVIFLFFVASFATISNSVYAKTTQRPIAQLLITHHGEILHSRNANQVMYPASLAKLMTIYLMFEALKNKKIDFNTRFHISAKAASMPASNIGLTRNDTITVREAILSLIVKSANDVAVVAAENLGGNEKNFARKMNIRAQQLGMANTHFTNSSGWHHPNQITTAYDMAKLAIALKRDFPQYYYLFSKNSFFYRTTLYQGHNHVNANLKGALGMKTGFTNKAGWNIVTSASRDDKELIGVILGGKSRKTRDGSMIKMMNLHFARFENNQKGLYALDRDTRVKKADKNLAPRKVA